MWWDKPVLDKGVRAWPINLEPALKADKLFTHIQVYHDHDKCAQMMVEGRMKVVPVKS